MHRHAGMRADLRAHCVESRASSQYNVVIEYTEGIPFFKRARLCIDKESLQAKLYTLEYSLSENN